MHARLPHHLLDEDVLKLSYNVVGCISTHVGLSRLTLTVGVLAFLATLLRRLALSLSGLGSKYGVSDALIVLKELSTHEFMALAGVKEANELANTLTSVHMSLIIITLGDRFPWALQTADVDACSGTRVVLEELGQVV